MNILFLHQNFPAQFRHVTARFAADAAHRVVAIGEESVCEYPNEQALDHGHPVAAIALT